MNAIPSHLNGIDLGTMSREQLEAEVRRLWRYLETCCGYPARPIPVSERLPKITHDSGCDASWSDPVLAYCRGEWCIFEYWNDGSWFEPGIEDQSKFDPSHWLPLPPNPE